MTLEEKSEKAFMNFLSSSEELKEVGFLHHLSDKVKNEEIVITATLGEEVSAPSGVFALNVEINIRVRNRRRAAPSPDRVSVIAGEVERFLMQNVLHERLTSSTKDFHCYHAELTGTERELEEGNIFTTTYNLDIEAMNASFKTAETLYSRIEHTTK